MSQSIQITTATVPSTFCFTTWQQSWSELVSLLSGVLTGNTNTFNWGKLTPTSDNQNKPWFRLNSDDSPDRWYVWWAGKWVSPSLPYDLNERRIYTGNAAAIWSYDGGDGVDPATTAPTIITGAMWEIDTALNARFPAGVGTTAGGTSITLTGTGGVDVLTTAQLPSHTHQIFAKETSSTQIAAGSTGAIAALGSYSDDASYDAAAAAVGNVANSGATSTAGSVTPTTSIPPYYGVYFIKRTARRFYTV